MIRNVFKTWVRILSLISHSQDTSGENAEEHYSTANQAVSNLFALEMLALFYKLLKSRRQKLLAEIYQSVGYSGV